MNKVLVLVERKLFVGFFSAYYEPYGFRVVTLKSIDQLEEREDTDVIVAHTEGKKIPLAKAVQKIRKQTPNIKVTCLLQSENSPLSKQIGRLEIDTYFTENHRPEEIDRKIKSLMFPHKYGRLRTEVSSC